MILLPPFLSIASTSSFTGQGTTGTVAITGYAGGLSAGFADQGAAGNAAITGYSGSLVNGFVGQGFTGAVVVTGFAGTTTATSAAGSVAGPIYIDNALIRGGLGGGRIVTEEYRRKAREEIERLYARIIEGVPERAESDEILSEAVDLVKPVADNRYAIPQVDRVKWDRFLEMADAVDRMIALYERIEELWDEEAAVLLLMAA